MNQAVKTVGVPAELLWLSKTHNSYAKRLRWSVLADKLNQLPHNEIKWTIEYPGEASYRGDLIDADQVWFAGQSRDRTTFYLGVLDDSCAEFSHYRVELKITWLYPN